MDIYTALGFEVIFIEKLPNVLPGFDREIVKLAERLLIKPRSVDARTGVLAEVTPGIHGVKPVAIKLIDVTAKEHVETLEVEACLVATGCEPNTKNLGLEALWVETSNGFVQVNETMRVLTRRADQGGEVAPGLWCIGDANGKMMLAHAASAQGVSAVDNIACRRHVLDHKRIPAACFTHPEIAFVGLTEEQAKTRAAKDGFALAKSVGHYRANSKVHAEGQEDEIAKIMLNKETGGIIGVHIIGHHAADLIQECVNAAMAAKTTVKELSFMVHTHPTLIGVQGRCGHVISLIRG